MNQRLFSLRAALRLFMLSAVLFFVGGCGGATITAPPRDPNPLPPAFAPLLSYYRFQHDTPVTSSVAGGHFVQTVAVGDFNGDGRLDLATGAPDREDGRVFMRLSFGAGNYSDVSFALSNLQQRPSGGDQFGWSLTACDFNADGLDDLAIGAPHRALEGEASAGAAFVLYGQRVVGLTYAGLTVIAQGQDGDVEAGDRLGFSLASGDFNVDGFCDLAIGAPGEDRPGSVDSGAVLIRWGAANGLGRQLTPRLLMPPAPQAGAQFGYALATGQFQTVVLSGGRYAQFDLAVSSPFYDVTAYSASERANLTYRDVGEVMFFWGGHADQSRLQPGTRLNDYRTDEPHFGKAMAAGRFTGGLDQLAVGAPHFLDERGYVAIVDPRRNEVVTRLFQDPDGLTDDGMWALGLDESGDEFGAALATGDFDGDNREDIAIGAPGEGWRAVADGVVFIRFSGPNGPALTNAFFLAQGGGVGWGESGDVFGTALASGDLSGDGNADLVIGAPGEDVEQAGREAAGAGALFVAVSRAPSVGPFDGEWTGTIDGDAGSEAVVQVDLMDRAGVVRGTTAVLSPGIIFNINELCAPGDDDDEEPSGPMSFVLDTEPSSDRPRHLASRGTFRVGGYDIPYSLVMDVAADLESMDARLTIDVPAVCGSDKTLNATLEKE